jgi:lipoprotein-anchoring transpeptidase ErfK/SrfK
VPRRIVTGAASPDCRRALIAASVVAIFAAAATPATAYERWGLFGPAIQQRPEPIVAPAKRLSKEAKARKYIAEQVKLPEQLPPGPLQIVISIKKQQLTLYAGGQAVAHSQVSTGVPGHPTPQGVFSVIQKQIYHESNLYSSAPMPYMQRITWSGVAMHQGVVPGRPASHGCIRLPAAFAKRLWSITRVGARVIIAQDDVALADIASPRLSALAPGAGVSAEAPLGKVRFATVESMSDAPLKGSIDAAPDNRNESARIESAIDQMVQAGMADADAYPGDDEKIAFAPEKNEAAATLKDPLLRPGPISVYVSRKTGRLYVRKGFDEVFDAPVTIAEPERPLGTHVFTALGGKDETGLRWNVASLPVDRVVKPGKYLSTVTPRGEKLRKELVAPEYQVTPPGDPSAALARITIPDAALARITELMSPGASLIVSDVAYSHETGRGTDFIVLTR